MSKDMNMRVFLTGANGFLGSHITRQLISKGYHVVAFVEKGKPYKTIEGLNNVTYCQGNILNKEEVERFSQDCEMIIHAAANTSVIPARSKMVNDINIIGTEHVISAALKHKVKRLIYIGSASSFGFGPINDPGNEAKPYSCGHIGLDYMTSKLAAHHLIMDAVKNKNLPAVVCCPTFMFGKYDSRPGPGAMITAVHLKKLPGYSSGGRNFVYVGDVATAIVNALELGRVGESYICGNSNMSYKDAFALIAKTIGAKAPSRRIPDSMLLVYGLFCTMVYKLTGKEMPINYSLAKVANAEFYYDNAKAIKELKFPQTPIEVAVKETFDWFIEQKMISPN